MLSQPREVITSWQKIWGQYQNDAQLKTRLGLERKELQSKAQKLNHENFYQLLQKRHGYSPAAAELNVKSMVKNHHLAKSIADTAWSEFLRLLSYKAKEAA